MTKTTINDDPKADQQSLAETLASCLGISGPCARDADGSIRIGITGAGGDVSFEITPASDVLMRGALDVITAIKAAKLFGTRLGKTRPAAEA